MQWALDQNIPTSGIREILELAMTRPDVIRLETGEPNFPPPAHVLTAYNDASKAGHNRYTASAGIPILREALAQKITRVNHVPRTGEELLVTPGGIPGLFLAFMGVATSGDEILVPNPGWPDYLGGMVSLRIRPVPYRLSAPDFHIDWDHLSRQVKDRTRAIVINSPGNPTGRIFTRSEVENVVAFAKDHHLWIISDEVYDQMVFSHDPISPAIIDYERTLSIYSFSKPYAMTGWRLGYLAAPVPIIQSLTKVAMGLWSSVSEPLQYAGLAALDGPQEIVSEMRDAYRARRDLAIALLNAAHIDCTVPDGAFYLLADITPSGLGSREFSLKLLDTCQVAVAPGSAFGDASDNVVRISLASSESDLREGLGRFMEYLQRH